MEELLDIILGGDGEIRGRIVDQGVGNAIPICCVVPIPCMVCMAVDFLAAGLASYCSSPAKT